MKPIEDLADEARVLTRAILPAAIAGMGGLASPALAQGAAAPTAPSFQGDVASLYTAADNYCPSGVIENMMGVRGIKKGVEPLNALLSNELKLEVFGTKDLTTLGANTIAINLQGDELYLGIAQPGESPNGTVDYGTNAKGGIGIYTANTWRSTNGQNLTPLGKIDPSQAEAIRNAICTIEQQDVANGGKIRIVTNPSGNGANPLEQKVTDAGARVVAHGLDGMAVTTHIRIDDFLGDVLLSSYDSASLSFAPGSGTLAKTNDGYVLVSAIPDDAEGPTKLATLTLTKGNDVYTFELEADVSAAPGTYTVSSGDAKSNAVINDAPFRIAQAFGMGALSLRLGSEGFSTAHEYASAGEMSGSLARRAIDSYTLDLTPASVDGVTIAYKYTLTGNDANGQPLENHIRFVPTNALEGHVGRAALYTALGGQGDDFSMKDVAHTGLPYGSR